MTPNERANLLLNKYPYDYVKEVVNGIITTSREKNETEICNYWNEIALEIKKIINSPKKSDI
jgi:hypothetical protein